MTSQKTDKPWGYEILLTDANLPYVAKIIYLKANNRLSLQYHDHKIETLTLISGQAQLTLGQDLNNLNTQTMIAQQGYTINQGMVHRISAVTDTMLFEASTPETGTTYRIEDDYHRGHQKLNIKH